MADKQRHAYRYNILLLFQAKSCKQRQGILWYRRPREVSYLSWGWSKSIFMVKTTYRSKLLILRLIEKHFFFCTSNLFTADQWRRRFRQEQIEVSSFSCLLTQRNHSLALLIPKRPPKLHTSQVKLRGMKEGEILEILTFMWPCIVINSYNKTN